MNPLALFAWIIGNWQQILGTLALVVAGASAAIKALEVITGALLVLFPGLKTLDGDLRGLAAWLDALGSAKWLNAIALSPSKTSAPAAAQVAGPAAGVVAVASKAPPFAGG